jgi:ubiquinone/menaquinone biosynthesis C-methylase UbiE
MEKTEFWSDYAPRRREPTHPVVASFVMEKLNFLRSRIHELEGKSVLDVGCGNGRFTYHFPTKNKVGLDFSEEMIKHARQLVRDASFIVANGYELPFQDKSFNIVFAGCYLHNLDDPLLALSEMARVASEYVILVEPNPFAIPLMLFNLFSGEEKRATVFKFTMKYYRDIFAKAGLEMYGTTRGFITPNRTPVWLKPFLTYLERLAFIRRFGCYFVIIGEKRPSNLHQGVPQD